MSRSSFPSSSVSIPFQKDESVYFTVDGVMGPSELQLDKNPYLKQNDVPLSRFKKRLKSLETASPERSCIKAKLWQRLLWEKLWVRDAWIHLFVGSYCCCVVNTLTKPNSFRLADMKLCRFYSSAKHGTNICSSCSVCHTDVLKLICACYARLTWQIHSHSKVISPRHV